MIPLRKKHTITIYFFYYFALVLIDFTLDILNFYVLLRF